MAKKSKKLEPRLLAALSDAEYRPLKQHELAKVLALKSSEKADLRTLLRNLEKDGKIVRLRKNRWSLPVIEDRVAGILQTHPAGFGYLIPEDLSREDIFIPRNAMGGARHKDRVEVSVVEPRPDKTGKRRRSNRPLQQEGEVVNVLKRGMPVIAGVLIRQGKEWQVLPEDPRLSGRVNITGHAHGLDLKKQQHVVVELDDTAETHAPMQGKLIEVLGDAETPGVDMEMLIRNFQLSEVFPDSVARTAAEQDVDISSNAMQRRKDLREDLIITIDPVDARDFDDAISLKNLPGGHKLLGVHIADVAHYVPQDSPIDIEARRRATSAYLVDRVITMLPENLTNRVCSLVPHEDRLTHSVEIELNPQGKIVKFDTYPSVIHSKHRFTYEEIQHFFDEGESDKIPQPVNRMLTALRSLTRKVRDKRMANGALGFMIPEIKCRLNERGKIKAIIKREPMEAYQLIEECMLLANQVIGTIMAARDIPSLWRIHEEPSEEQWASMAAELKGLGITTVPSHRDDLNEIAAEAITTDSSFPVMLAMLKNINRALYSPRLHEHFGLAFDVYAHFTSPIRRYPDLIIHRILNAVETEGPLPYTTEELKSLAQHCSEQEKNAEQAEKESVRIKLLQYYQERLKQGKTGPYPGHLVNILPRGFLVELNESLQRGLVSFAMIKNDHIRVEDSGVRARGERSGKTWRVGDPVKVILVRVDEASRQIDFALADGSDPAKKPSPWAKSSKKKAGKRKSKSRAATKKKSKARKNKR